MPGQTFLGMPILLTNYPSSKGAHQLHITVTKYDGLTLTLAAEQLLLHWQHFHEHEALPVS